MQEREEKRLEEERLVKLIRRYQSELRGLASRLRRDHGLVSHRVSDVLSENLLGLLSGGGLKRFDSPEDFLSVAAKAMRDLVIDLARRRNAQKRDASRRVPLQKVRIDDLVALSTEDPQLVAEVHDLLDRLREEDEGAATNVELRAYCGMTQPEIAAALGISLAAVKRDSTFAMAWLREASEAWRRP